MGKNLCLRVLIAGSGSGFCIIWWDWSWYASPIIPLGAHSFAEPAGFTPQLVGTGRLSEWRHTGHFSGRKSLAEKHVKHRKNSSRMFYDMQRVPTGWLDVGQSQITERTCDWWIAFQELALKRGLANHSHCHMYRDSLPDAHRQSQVISHHPHILLPSCLPGFWQRESHTHTHILEGIQRLVWFHKSSNRRRSGWHWGSHICSWI